jgi:2-succinyl-6-hydroxy-2,4-cyclohexadiene-1-carboxylate synthase
MLTPTAEVNGLAVYASPAAEETVLWIHGYTLDSTIWNGLWTALPGWRHIAVDLAGHGRSRPLRKDDTLSTLGLTLVQIAEYYEVRHFVGMSFGAMVALQAAIESPRSFASLTLGSPALAGGPTDTDAATKHLRLCNMRRERGVGPWLGELWMQWPPDIFKGASRHPPLWNALIEVVGRHSWSELESNQMDQLTRGSQLPHLAAVTCPTLILVGEEDMAAFKRCAELIQRAVPICTRIYLPSTGHLGLLESTFTVAPILHAHWQQAEVPSSK